MKEVLAILKLLISMFASLKAMRCMRNFKLHIRRINVGGWGVSYSIARVSIPIDELRIYLNTESGLVLMCIDDSPHYRCVSGAGCDEYADYIEQYFPGLDKDKRVDRLIELKKYLVEGGQVADIVVKYSPRQNVWCVIDGVHRLSIDKVIGQTLVSCVVV